MRQRSSRARACDRRPRLDRARLAASPADVCALATTRNGGVSSGPRAIDEPRPHTCATTRRRSSRESTPPAHVPARGARVARAGARRLRWRRSTAASADVAERRVADAAVTREPRRRLRGPHRRLPAGAASPIARGHAVGIAHAGWRGLAAGVLEATIAAIRDVGASRTTSSRGSARRSVPHAFEVGADVRDRVLRRRSRQRETCFAPHGRGQVARRSLRACASAPRAQRSIAGGRRRLLHAHRCRRASSRIAASATRAAWPPSRGLQGKATSEQVLRGADRMGRPSVIRDAYNAACQRRCARSRATMGPVGLPADSPP